MPIFTPMAESAQTTPSRTKFLHKFMVSLPDAQWAWVDRKIGYAASLGQYKGILGERQSASEGRSKKRGAKPLDPTLF
jgi:hypothetical protein